MDIEAIFVVGIDRSFQSFKRVANPGMQFVEEGSLKGIAQEFVVEVFFMLPAERISDTAFRDEAMDVRIPF